MNKARSAALAAALLSLYGTAPARAQTVRAARPVLSPTLPVAGTPSLAVLPSPSLSASVSATPALLPALAVPQAPTAVPAPAPAARASAARASAAPAAAAFAQLDSTARTLDDPARRADRPGVSASLFDGTARPSGSVAAVPVSARARNGSLERPGQERRFPGELMGDQGAVATPGSIFGWKPWEEAPGHGFLPVDAAVRRFFASPADRLARGFEFRGAPRREDARVFLYGEKHSDKALIETNMRALARDMDAQHAGLVLVEGYIGPTLRGTMAVRFLESRGFDPERLAEREVPFSLVEVRGWDEPISHDDGTRPSLRHHMALLELNILMHSDERGLSYYKKLYRALKAVWRAYFEMRRVVIDARNLVLDAAVAEAVRDAREHGQTVHVVAGAEHLLEKPLLARVPLVGGIRMRKSLQAALGTAPWWASKPAEGR